jgi:hypothetical protein
MLSIGDDAHHRNLEPFGDLPQQAHQGLLRCAQKAACQKDLPGEALAHHPQNLVAHVRLQPVQGEDRSPLPLKHLSQPVAIREPYGHQLLVTIEQIGHRALGDAHPSTEELAVDLRHAAMMSVAQSTHQRYDIQAELALGQREGALLLGPARFLVECALPVHAATDDQPETHRSFQRADGAGAVIGDPHPLAARFAQIA